MRRLTIIQHMSLDGVIQSPGAPDEDREGGFAAGGWIRPYGAPEIGEAIGETHTEGFDLVLGRRTYDIWSGHWPTADPSPFSDAINAATKHVATSRPDTLDWGPAEGIGPDLPADLRRIRAAEGPDLVVWGSSTLIAPLLGEALADRVILLIYPVLLGTGKRIFPEGRSPRGLTLASVRPASSGVMICTFGLEPARHP